MDDFSKYQVLRNDGKSALEVGATAKMDGLDQKAMIRMLRQVFGLSISEAKAASFEVHTGRSLHDYQGEIAPQIAEILDPFERDS
jgi:hypothetical protein